MNRTISFSVAYATHEITFFPLYLLLFLCVIADFLFYLTFDLYAVSTMIFQRASISDSIDDWKWKLNMLNRNKREQEIVSREKKDRRDYKQLSALATTMGLYRYA